MADDLGTFEGAQVLNTTIAITNAGDGLSAAMQVDPVLLHLGDTVYVVLECEVGKIRFDPIKNTEAVGRIQVLRAGTATIIEADAVREAITTQAERIRMAAEKKAGVAQLIKDDQQHAFDHEMGEHEAEAVVGCPRCDSIAESNAADG